MGGDKERNAQRFPTENEYKATSLMLREHLMKLIEAMTEKEKSLRVCREWELSRRMRA
jgi:hypothetical protein